VLLGVVAFLVAFLFLMAWGCGDVGGVSSWERCRSAMGTPAFSVEDWGLDASLNALIPVVLGLLVGIVTWWIGRPRHPDRA
jgi:NhaP-type Na+/H+ or K+/H+ antiporter